MHPNGADHERHIVPNRNRCGHIDTQSTRDRRGSQFRNEAGSVGHYRRGAFNEQIARGYVCL